MQLQSNRGESQRKVISPSLFALISRRNEAPYSFQPNLVIRAFEITNGSGEPQGTLAGEIPSNRSLCKPNREKENSPTHRSRNR